MMEVVTVTIAVFNDPSIGEKCRPSKHDNANQVLRADNEFENS